MSKFDINGQTPVAAWVPSRDNAGNGTTTLTDLIADKNGTLTNMDPATDWVSDTDAGGIRALDFDGTNDNVNIGDNFNDVIAGSTAKWSVSAWVNLTTTANVGFVSKIADGNHGESARQILLGCNSGFARMLWFGALDGTSLRVFEARAVNLNAAGWSHIAITFDATIATINSKAEIWVNGSPQSLTLVAQGGTPAFIPSGTARFAIGAGIGIASSATPYAWRGRIDDVRLADWVFDADDVGYLWNDGEGRGIVQASGNIRRRQEESMMMASRSGL